MAATTTRDLECPPSAVFDVLRDGWLYAVWVVGAGRIRDVEPGWPAVGTKIHHSVGSWPALIDDTTSVLEMEPDRLLKLRGRAWPAGEAEITITLSPTADGCRVAITEDAVKGPGTLIPPAVRHALLHWRNTETLRRLDYVATGRARG
ncbi:polyketide cyclase [Nakamurella endophytica]|uniref:Polyketide cyclase n=1 Tax=Nakamurella endophytica TaxID=1748367 RepID=A0A917TC18_9ACTN|nr:polyketide cyclase [Nakamurella endophytica]